LNDLPRTTNIAEAWHRSFNYSVERSHPNLGKFINNIQKEEEKTRVKILQWNQGLIELQEFMNKKNEN
jgi:hypothetical protein